MLVQFLQQGPKIILHELPVLVSALSSLGFALRCHGDHVEGSHDSKSGFVNPEMNFGVVFLKRCLYFFHGISKAFVILRRHIVVVHDAVVFSLDILRNPSGLIGELLVQIDDVVSMLVIRFVVPCKQSPHFVGPHSSISGR